MNKKLTFLLALTFLFFVGCQIVGGRLNVGPPIQFGNYVQANTTERDWGRDSSECGSLSNVGSPQHYAEKHILFHNCMFGKGWDFVDVNGNPTNRDIGKAFMQCKLMDDSIEQCKKK